MGYLEDFQQRVNRDDYQGFLQLWEEYCGAEAPDADELIAILEMIKESRFAGRFGTYAETALSFREKIDEPQKKFAIFRLIIDLETTNSPELAELVFSTLKERYGDDPYFTDKIRLIGLRNGDNFQGAIRNYELLSHLKKGAFVYHTGGWGTGEVIDVSFVREELILEFEAVAGQKRLSFENAFSNLVVLDKEHFLSRRFGDPDKLEEEARNDPVAVVRDLLHDLGPKTAGELKEELVDLVIPAEGWTKWWQAARGRIKKDTGIETPKSIRQPFRLRREAVSHADQMRHALTDLEDPGHILAVTYNFVRDFPEVLREAELREFIQAKLRKLLSKERLDLAWRVEIAALLEEFFEERVEPGVAALIAECDNVPSLIKQIEIVALKKRALVTAREVRQDWVALFLEVLYQTQQSNLRDYLVRELSDEKSVDKLVLSLEDLLEAPIRQPHLFVWFFQKVMSKGAEMPLGQKEHVYRWMEAFLTLMHQLDYVPEYRELGKKMYAILTAKRYHLIREALQDSTVEFAREFLLLESKCHLLSVHDHKIMQSLVEVVHPQLSEKKTEGFFDVGVVWTTKEGYEKLRSRIEQIGTVETVDNAKEIERAREHGDLRENAEYKAALERRSRLQAELKMLSDQLNKARILTSEDVTTEITSVGSIVELTDPSGKTSKYALLGPWDADPEKHILSYQSKLAKAVMGLKVGDQFTYQDKEYSIRNISSYFSEG